MGSWTAEVGIYKVADDLCEWHWLTEVFDDSKSTYPTLAAAESDAYAYLAKIQARQDEVNRSLGLPRQHAGDHDIYVVTIAGKRDMFVYRNEVFDIESHVEDRLVEALLAWHTDHELAFSAP